MDSSIHCIAFERIGEQSSISLIEGIGSLASSQSYHPCFVSVLFTELYNKRWPLGPFSLLTTIH
jgi:hypothetical protein